MQERPERQTEHQVAPSHFGSQNLCNIKWKEQPNMRDEAAFIIVPSMMPRPLLISALALTYRKIPVLAINQDVCSSPLSTYPDLSCSTLQLNIPGLLRHLSPTRDTELPPTTTRSVRFAPPSPSTLQHRDSNTHPRPPARQPLCRPALVPHHDRSCSG
jgi:hypothetical protein